jgi:hypothetical protein
MTFLEVFCARAYAVNVSEDQALLHYLIVDFYFYTQETFYN